MSNVRDLRGMIIGELKVIKRCDDSGIASNGACWDCVCIKCGATLKVPTSLLIRKYPKRCEECSRSEDIIKLLKDRYHTILSVAVGNKSGRGAKYIGFGIVPEWRERDNFITWAIKNGFNSATQCISYIGNGEPAGPTTMAVLTMREKNSTRSDNFNVTYNNETHHVNEWSRISKTKVATIRYRLRVYKWDVGQALFARPYQRKGTPIYDHKGNFVCNKT